MSRLSERILHNSPLNRYNNTGLGVSSIIRNVQCILNTRSSIGIKAFLNPDTELDNLTFGLPDLAFLSISSPRDKQLLADVIKKSIATFEPRLKGVLVELGSYDALKREIIVKVSAHFDRDNVAVNFLLNLSTLEFSIDERER